jgi:hypothetical protein
LLALEHRVRRGDLADPGEIGRAAERIVRGSGVERLFDLEISTGRFLYHYDEGALDYEEQLLAGRYVLLTSHSPTRLPTADVLRTYRGLLRVEDRFKVLKDFLGLAATIEALIAADLRTAGIRDPDKPGQVLSARRALRELNRIRLEHIEAGEQSIDLVTRRTPLQREILAALSIDTSTWDRATIT